MAVAGRRLVVRIHLARMHKVARYKASMISKRSGKEEVKPAIVSLIAIELYQSSFAVVWWEKGGCEERVDRGSRSRG